MAIDSGFLADVVKRFESYKALGDKTFEQLEDKDYFFRPSAHSNSIAIIIQHLYGNMLSRWTHFLTEDGEKSWRRRDDEFEDMDVTVKDLRSFWEEGWKCLFDALKSLKEEDLQKTVYIRSEPLKAYDAILRQLAHYPYHVGQIVQLGKMVRDAQWQSLSIPKGQSNQYNQHMQQKP